jgi:hypothetical protein
MRRRGHKVGVVVQGQTSQIAQRSDCLGHALHSAACGMVSAKEASEDVCGSGSSARVGCARHSDLGVLGFRV